MANYPKTRKTENPELVNGWEKTIVIPGSHGKTKYTRWYSNSRYGNLRADLYHVRSSNLYSYEIMNLDKSYSTGKFQAETLEKAQKLVDLAMDANMVE